MARRASAEARPAQWRAYCPEPTWGWHIIHTTASRGDTATALLGATQPPRTASVRASLEPLLAGQTDPGITAWEAEGPDPTCTGPPRQAVRWTVGASRRTQPSLHDHDSLARGGPMGTGGVAGAGGPRGHARLEPAGRRWTPGGAQVVRDRRAVRLHGHGEA